MGAPAVAVVIAREKQVVLAFRRAGATSPASAVSPESIGVDRRLAFRRLHERAVLREASSGAFYLDEPSWQALQSTRRRMGLTILTIVVLVSAYFLLLARPR
jgi:hypothetical protein